MRFIHLTLVLASFLLCTNSLAQQSLPIPRNIQAAYDKGTRSPDGTPGKHYWENTADYDLKINFDPTTRILNGTEEIVYTNNSPDTLRPIFFKLYPNLFKKGAIRNSPVLPEDLIDGVKILSMTMGSETIDSTRIRIDGTNMIVGGGHRIFPGQNVHFSIRWTYKLNKTPSLRTGEIDPGTDFVAYFFPRIAVYDDIDGWNTYQYNGSQEFYNDFCHFKAAITVPNNQAVWGTGRLLNAKDVFSDRVYQRMQQAEKGDDVITVIDSTEIAAATNPSTPTNTWQFEASDVTDFVFACSDHYMWHSTSLVVDKSTGRRTRVDAVFNPKHKDYFDVIHDARRTVEAMSYEFPKWPYPYPHETVVDGLDQMEYPMMVNDNPLADHAESIELTDHEIFHTMFPFYMGINETKYAWMDEGWATIGEWLISPIIDTSIVDLYGVVTVERNAGNETDLPITTLSTEIGRADFTNSYPKPAMGYLFVKDMLGDDIFYKGLHNYIQQWHGKHPMPLDFFNCMNKGSGRDLNWFWKKWFYDDGIPDLSISKVVQTGSEKQITIESIGTKPVPVDIAVTFDDESTKTFHQSISVWEKGNKTTTVKFTAQKKITKVVLGSVHTPDSNRKNNTWSAKP
jgi:hypothetical protein